MLSLAGIGKSFGPAKVLSDVSLEIADGEFFSLLGPSGCGKTTLLRIIGGQESGDCGKILLNGIDITTTPPSKRPVHMIFQRLALFPHLNVRNNIAFGLRLKKMKSNEITRQVDDVLTLVRLEGFGDRKIATLSGGQQQRVAVARAIVNEPKLLLLDEPLSALDLKLRQKMQSELRNLQKKLGMTFVFVTHDQDEALSLSDRIAVMNHGVIEQVGTPEAIYRRPESPFVAGFVGAANFFNGNCLDGERVAVAGADVLGQPVAGKWQARSGSEATVIVRPEHMLMSRMGTSKSSSNRGIIAKVESLVFRGGHTEVYCRVDTGQTKPTLVSCFVESELPGPGTLVALTWQKEHAVVMHGHHGL